MSQEDKNSDLTEMSKSKEIKVNDNSAAEEEDLLIERITKEIEDYSHKKLTELEK